MAEEQKKSKDEITKKEKESTDRILAFQQKASKDLDQKLQDAQKKTQTILADLNKKHEKESKLQLSQVEKQLKEDFANKLQQEEKKSQQMLAQQKEEAAKAAEARI